MCNKSTPCQSQVGGSAAAGDILRCMQVMHHLSVAGVIYARTSGLSVGKNSMRLHVTTQVECL